MVKLPFSNKITGRARASEKGQAGYDNPRENIDPHIKTQVVSTKEIIGQKIEGSDYISGAFIYGDGSNLTNLTGDNLGNHIATKTISGSGIIQSTNLSGGSVFSSNGVTGAYSILTALPSTFQTFTFSGGILLSVV